MRKFQQPIFLTVGGLLLAGVFVVDVARSRVPAVAGELSTVRELVLFLGYGLVFAVLAGTGSGLARSLPREIGKIVVVGVGILFGAPLVTWLPGYEFTERGAALVPANVMTLLLATLVSASLVLFALVLVRGISLLALHRRKKTSKRNLTIYTGAMLISVAGLLPVAGQTGGVASSAGMGIAILAAIVVSFRQGWVVYLSRREKLYSIAYSVLLFVATVVLLVLLSNRTPINKAMAFYSAPLQQFVVVNTIFGAIYFGMTFVSTLFHLPTAEAYERRQSELSSLHHLGRLITRVFDFQDLVTTVTRMAREVCGARSAWLELARAGNGGDQFEVVAADGIDVRTIELAVGSGDRSLRSLVALSRKPVLIEAVDRDRRTRHLSATGLSVSSIISVPLLSQERLVGILHATSDQEYAFDQEEMEVLRTFADHVTIAIENARLIEESMRRERYRQEMLVARQVQRRLLPQELPSHPAFELSAFSEQSSEVGGDYYDVVELDDRRVGIVVGDVSGKGVSAAFYMAEVKGIFQSLSKLYQSPRDLLIRANGTLVATLERNSFVSFLYGILDVSAGALTLARAGHCPMLFVSGEHRELIRPSGLGLGLAKDEIFAHNVEERTLHLRPGDLCVFYTDGVTESRSSGGEEFGEERLTDLVMRNRHASAAAVKEELWKALRAFTSGSDHVDDLTFVILAWKGKEREPRAPSSGSTSAAQRR